MPAPASARAEGAPLIPSLAGPAAWLHASWLHAGWVHAAWTQVVPVLQIVWINLLLSGDNAVVIALACRDLDRRRRAWATFAGAGAAIVLRVLFTFVVVSLLRLPTVSLLSGGLLFWIAIDLLRRHDPAGGVAAAGSLWAAIRTIAVADAAMSLDNVVAVASAARNSLSLIVFGIALSVPMIVLGSALILPLLKRFPILGVAGAALLGWVAGEIMLADPLIDRLPDATVDMLRPWARPAGAGAVLLAAGLLHLLRRRAAQKLEHGGAPAAEP